MTTTDLTTPADGLPVLLPCPRCAGTPELAAAEVEHWNGCDYMIWIRCTAPGCDIQLDRSFSLSLTLVNDQPALEQKIAATRAKLIDKWNQRATPAAPVPASAQTEALRMIGAILDALIRYGHPSSPALAVALATCAQGLDGDMQPAPAYAAILAAVEDQRDRFRQLLADALPFLTDDAATPLRRRAAAALNPLDARPIGDTLPAEPAQA
jgi:hypothetical protein